ncbi:hypothetical protein DFH09DRAFT_1362568 [Mycena vulgaris]|nr:hypothetical protein DFH09DRAFT_1362568 [Mycena vulgaris]
MHTSWEVQLDPCGHLFCRDCITSHVQSKLAVRQYPVSCPTCLTSAQHSAHPSAIWDDVLIRLSINEDQLSIFKTLQRLHI